MFSLKFVGSSLFFSTLLFTGGEANQPHFGTQELTNRYAVIPRGPDSINRRAVIPGCLISASTDGWTTCASFIAKYQIPLANFVAMNPAVGATCQQFQPGVNYCIEKSFQLPISSDGKCGSNAPTLVTCINSSFGNCCGKDGFCGSTAAFCAIGNCQGGRCPGLGYSYDGTCGTQNNYLLCGGSWGTCCSNSGQCGSTNAFCGVGNCQSGACTGVTATATTTTISTVSTTSVVPLPTPRTPSPDGTCGYINKYICNGTNPQHHYGKCCSAAGYCGLTPHHCDSLLGCQDAFGLCDKTIYVTVTVTQLPSTTTATTTSTTPIVTSTPFIPGMVSNCDAFKYINAGDTCASLAAGRGVSLANFMAFNPGLPKGCVSGLWLGWYVCTSIVGHTPGPPYTVVDLPSPPPTHLAVYNGFRLWGCVTGYTSVSHILTGRYADVGMTVQKCITQAILSGAMWAGIEIGTICRYGTSLVLPAGIIYPSQKPMSSCNTPCGGQPENWCGGANHMDLYEKM